jgi:hypothetical protein
MLIWILALILVLACAVLGYTWGAVRTGITTIGLLLASALAGPVAPVLYPVFDKLSLGTRFHALFLAPLVVILVIMIIFKIVASKAHQKVDTHYKYHAPEYVQTLWTRTNERFGAVLGVVNSAIYLFIIAVFISVMAYPISQLSSGEEDSAAWRYLLKAADGLQSTKLNRAAAAFNPASRQYYEISDMLGMVYQNPLLVGRLTSYPPIVEMGERNEFRAMYDKISQDAGFKKEVLSMPKVPFQQLMGEESFRLILTNKLYLKELFKLDHRDLSNYLVTGASPKFEEKILGRWIYNEAASLSAQRQTKPKWTRAENNRLMTSYASTFHDLALLGLINNRLVIKAGQPNQPPAVTKGTWAKGSGDKYTLTIEGPWVDEVEIRGALLIARYKLEGETRFVVFEKE